MPGLIKNYVAKLTSFNVIVIRYLLLNCYNLVNFLMKFLIITGFILLLIESLYRLNSLLNIMSFNND